MLPAAHVLANMTAFRSADAALSKHPGSFLAQKLQQLQARSPRGDMILVQGLPGTTDAIPHRVT